MTASTPSNYERLLDRLLLRCRRFGRHTITAQQALDSLFADATRCPAMMDAALTEIGVGFGETATLGELWFYMRQ